MRTFLQPGQQAVDEVEAGFDGDDHAGLQLAGEAQEGMAFGRFDAAAVGAGHEAADVVYLQADQVEVTGEVDSARQFMARMGIMIVPLHSASGVRVKIIEGMAMGKAIVSTKVGAEGIDYTDGENILIASNPKEFREKLSYLAQHPEEVQRLGNNARKLARECFDNRTITQNLLNFYNSLIQS